MRSYEELVGGMGRAVAFRARRQLVRDLLRDQAAVLVLRGAQFPLYDLAISGVSFLVPQNQAVGGIHDVVDIEIVVHDATAYRGPARIAREERAPEQRRVAVQLLGGFLDLPGMQRADQEQLLLDDLRDGPERSLAAVPESYRKILMEAVLFTSYYRRALAEHETRIGESGRAEFARNELALRAITAIRPRWHELRVRAAEATLPLRASRGAMAGAKEATELLLTPILQAAPVLSRAYHKPLGHAGDFTVMTHIYKDGFEGDTVFGRVFHKLACEEPLSAGVRAWKDLVKELTLAEHRRKASQSAPLHVLSLGCGPAREVVECLSEAKTRVSDIHWTLVDQEERALSVAYHDVMRALLSKGDSCSLQCLFMSFEQLIKDAQSLQGELQDFIYCVGLFHYLDKRRAQNLLATLYDRLAPGGLVAVGNACWPNDHFWLADFVLDWHMFYRTPDELRDLAMPLTTVGATLEVRRESAGAYDFILIRKPGGGA